MAEQTPVERARELLFTTRCPLTPHVMTAVDVALIQWSNGRAKALAQEVVDLKCEPDPLAHVQVGDHVGREQFTPEHHCPVMWPVTRDGAVYYGACVREPVHPGTVHFGVSEDGVVVSTLDTATGQVAP